MDRPIRRPHYLFNTFSGVAGEGRVAAEFVRCGFRVARPLWTDDEVDLLVIMRSPFQTGDLVPIAVQVKSVQFIPNMRGQLPNRVFIKGLRKRYLMKSPALSLAVYRPDTDEIYFIDGGQNIQAVYESQLNWNRKHRAFSTLKDEDDVRIALSESEGIDGEWKVNPRDARWLSERMNRIAKKVGSPAKLRTAVEALFIDHPPTRFSR
jgi:hypothetical protein